MTINDARNILVSGLHGYTGRKVILSSQTLPESDMPYILYEPLQPRMPLGYNHIDTPQADDTVRATRQEHVEGTYSITACSCNRQTPDGYIHGLDEAQALADEIYAWLTHAGRIELSLRGITIADVSNVQTRSELMIDEVDRRVGMDVRIRYVINMDRIDPAVEPTIGITRRT